MKIKVKRLTRRDWYFNTILQAKPEVIRLLDQSYPGWSKDFKLMRAEFLSDPRYKGVILRWYISPRQKQPGKRR